MAVQKALNIIWHDGEVTKRDRETLLGQKGVVLWLTGLSGSGKSTIACEVEKKLLELGRLAYVLDGDNIRFGLNKNLGFSPGDRSENIRRISEVAKLFADAGIITLTAFISPYRDDRDKARGLFKPDEFIEIYVQCPIDICEKRDAKGLYKKAKTGEIKEFTGISAPYEEPLSPELVLKTSNQSPAESAENVIKYLAYRGIIRR